MKGAEFLRKIQALGKQRRVDVSVVTKSGKGSHVKLEYGTRFTILKDRKKEIGPGLLADMLKQLGLSKLDLP